MVFKPSQTFMDDTLWFVCCGISDCEVYVKVLVEAPLEAVEEVLDEFDLDYVTDPLIAEVLIPDPLKWVELYKYPQLKMIVTPSTGTNHIPLTACKKHGIKVFSLLDDREALNEIRASSEFTFMLILLALRNGAFRQWKGYDRNDDAMRGHELYGKKALIVGYGRIGQNVDDWLAAFGAEQIILVDKENSNGLSSAFPDADIVVLSCSLTPETTGMITGELVASMKPNAVLVNTSRGEVVREDELVEVLRERKDITYATDVLAGEATGAHLNSPLLSMPNVIVTPHIAGTTFESQQKAMRIALRLVEQNAE